MNNNKKIKNYFFTSIIISGFLLLIYLGYWQLMRLEQKESYIANIFKSLSLPPKDLGKVVDKAKDIKEYSHILAKGEIVPDKIMWLYRKHPQAKYKEGAYLVLIFKANKKYNFITVVGWVEKMNFNKIENYLKSGNKLNLTGLLLKGEKESFLLPNNDYKNRLLFTLDIQNIAKFLNVKVENFYFASLSNNLIDLPIIKLTPNMLIKVYNKHLEYAIMWFSLAAILAGIYFWNFQKFYKGSKCFKI